MAVTKNQNCSINYRGIIAERSVNFKYSKYTFKNKHILQNKPFQILHICQVILLFLHLNYKRNLILLTINCEILTTTYLWLTYSKKKMSTLGSFLMMVRE